MSDYTEYTVAVIYDEETVEETRYESKTNALRYAHNMAFQGYNVSVVDVADGYELFRAYS